MRKIKREVAEKFAELLTRRNVDPGRSLETCLRQSASVHRDSATNYLLARELGLRDVNKIVVRSVRVNAEITAYFIVYKDVVIEVMTHRAYTRTIRRRWERNAAAPLDGGRDGERFSDALKHKRPKRVGGGLMRGKLTPRKVKLSILDTHTLRVAKG